MRHGGAPARRHPVSFGDLVVHGDLEIRKRLAVPRDPPLQPLEPHGRTGVVGIVVHHVRGDEALQPVELTGAPDLELIAGGGLVPL